MFPFEVDPTSDVPTWVQLRQRLLYLINTGYFKPGDKLPTVRGLASEISINYNTVNRAYKSLVSDGYLNSITGSGVYVCDLEAEDDDGFSSELDSVIGDCIEACRGMGLSLDDIQRRMAYRVQQIKFKESREAGERPSRGRIVPIDVAVEESARKRLG